MTIALSQQQKNAVLALEQKFMGQITVMQVNGAGLTELHASAPDAISSSSIDKLKVSLAALSEINNVPHLNIEGTILVMQYSLGNLSGDSREKALDMLKTKIKRTIAHKAAMDTLGIKPGTSSLEEEDVD